MAWPSWSDLTSASMTFLLWSNLSKHDSPALTWPFMAWPSWSDLTYPSMTFLVWSNLSKHDLPALTWPFMAWPFWSDTRPTPFVADWNLPFLAWSSWSDLTWRSCSGLAFPGMTFLVWPYLSWMDCLVWSGLSGLDLPAWSDNRPTPFVADLTLPFLEDVTTFPGRQNCVSQRLVRTSWRNLQVQNGVTTHNDVV